MLTCVVESIDTLVTDRQSGALISSKSPRIIIKHPELGELLFPAEQEKVVKKLCKFMLTLDQTELEFIWSRLKVKPPKIKKSLFTPSRGTRYGFRD